MNVTLYGLTPSGTLSAIPSKSHVHRLLIAAALSDQVRQIRCDRTNADIDATVRCLNALGATITFENGLFTVSPIRTPVDGATLPVGESGSTLRFLIPVVAALGVTAHFFMEGRLPNRPLSPLREVLMEHGASFSDVGSNPLTLSGKLKGGIFSYDGGVSSQFTTGLLLVLPLLEQPSLVTLTGKIESRPYIDLTVATLKSFGIRIKEENNTFSLDGTVPAEATLIEAEGDWSNGAFMLALGAFSHRGMTVTGLDAASAQGDRAIVPLLRQFGAAIIEEADGALSLKRGELTAIPEIDASDIPDLVPILSVLAAAAHGTTRIRNCGRLRIKESDRIASVCAMLTALGVKAYSIGDDILIEGTGRIGGGRVNSFNDHRIAMSAAVASVLAHGPVTILGAEAVNKSYPAFYEDLGMLSGQTIPYETEPKEN